MKGRTANPLIQHLLTHGSKQEPINFLLIDFTKFEVY